MWDNVFVGGGVGVDEALREGVRERVWRPLRLEREDHLYFIGEEGDGPDLDGDEGRESRWTFAEVGFRKGRGPVMLDVVWLRNWLWMRLWEERSEERGIVVVVVVLVERVLRRRQWRFAVVENVTCNNEMYHLMLIQHNIVKVCRY